MEQISPPNKSSSSNPKTKLSIEFWIKIWGIGLILMGFSTRFAGVPFETLFFLVGYGFALIGGKRLYGIRMIGLCLSAILIFGCIRMAYIYGVVAPTPFRYYYFLVSTLFYIGLFTFLLMPDVKQVFGSSPPPKPLPILTQAEERKIRFWVRTVAVILIVEGVINSVFFDWLLNHGLPAEKPWYAAPGIIAGGGLVFFRQNIGRRFGLFVCLAIWFGGIGTLAFGNQVSNLLGYSYSILIITIFFVAFLFLLHPKTKAAFK